MHDECQSLLANLRLVILLFFCIINLILVCTIHILGEKMKSLILFVGIILISSTSFASISSSSLSKDSAQLHALGSAWKTYSSLRPSPNTNDITIVYGGADVSRRPTAPYITTTV